MTYIEFFDINVAENICACLAKIPDRVVLIGSSRKILEKHANRYRNLFFEKGIDIEFIPQSINKNDILEVIDTLSKLVEKYDDCVIELTGGEDVFLLAIGIVCERYKEKKIQIQRFNLMGGTVMDCDGDKRVLENMVAPALSIRDSVRAYGGDVAYGDVHSTKTYLWDMTEDFKNDIGEMWKICRKDAKAWNVQISLLGDMDEIGTVEGLSTAVSVDRLKKHIEKKDYSFSVDFDVIAPLRRAGLITEYVSDADTFGITYKNEQVKRCLIKAGQVLEMIIFLAACEAKEKDGTPVYNDVQNGVRIDWDGEIHSGEGGLDIENEIDVVMMRGVVPVFVSCKNGRLEMEELYKLDSVSRRFGGIYAKKVLVTTTLEFAGSFGDYFRKRAAEMDICIIDDAHKLGEAELLKTIKSLWQRA